MTDAEKARIREAADALWAFVVSHSDDEIERLRLMSNLDAALSAPT